MARHPREGLEKAALHYLSQRSASTQQLVRFLERRLERIARREDRVRDEEERALDEEAVAKVVAKMTRLRYLDDAAYARGKRKAMRARGASGRKIRAALAVKGVDTELVDETLEAEDADDDLRAALRLARRRRFGPFRRDEDADDERRRKELAAIGRAGFGYGVAKRVLAMSREDADALLRG